MQVILDVNVHMLKTDQPEPTNPNQPTLTEPTNQPVGATNYG